MAWPNGYAERFPEIAAWGVARSSQMRATPERFQLFGAPRDMTSVANYVDISCSILCVDAALLSAHLGSLLSAFV